MSRKTWPTPTLWGHALQLDVYLQETASHARLTGVQLDAARERLLAAPLASSPAAPFAAPFSALEYGGILHALQTLAENAIGKAKQLCRHHGGVVPPNAYDAFLQLQTLGLVSADQVVLWRNVIGLRNRIVHDYLNVDSLVIYDVLRRQDYALALDFLLDLQVTAPAASLPKPAP